MTGQDDRWMSLAIGHIGSEAEIAVRTAACDRYHFGMGVSKRWGWFLIGFSAWNLWVWATFVWNVYPQHHFDSFFGVHAAIGGVTTLLGFGIGSLGLQIVRAEHRPA